MPKAVPTTKVDPSYDDLPEHRFPRRYLKAAKAALGEWIVYYEPRRASADLSSRGGRQSYFATARIVHIGRDPNRDDHYYAYVEDYLGFDRAVPFREGSFYYERGLQKADGSTNKGRFGRSVRHLADAEYGMILAAGFEAGDDKRQRSGIREGERHDTGLELVDRPIVQWVSRRPFRDRVFATGIKRAYDNTCVNSGLRIINGGGRAGAQAAHIQPVKDNGPDSLRNGVEVDSTRGLLGLVNRDRRLRVNQRFVRAHQSTRNSRVAASAP